jgi:phenylalanyl-tRNA synthetase alpha chain
MQIILAAIVDALTRAWRCTVDVQRRRPVVAVEDNYDRLGYAPADIVRDARYSRYVAETVMLRSHTTAGIPPALRQLANTQKGEPASDVLLALPGLCYRRDSIDRLHVGTPHQVDLWRMTTAQMYDADLMRMAGIVIDTVLPGARWRAVPANHPYTRHGRQLDVETSIGWVELAECGLVAPHILAAAGLDPQRCSGLALGLGLDRAVMLRKGLDDIRQLRSAHPRIAAQMLDLTRWQPVSARPPIRRDLSIVTTGPPDAELLGGAVRSALGAAAEDLESVSILNSTPWEHLSPAARARLGMRPGQQNVVLRLVLRPLDRSLTAEQANQLRDQVYATIHEGPTWEWAARTGL